MTGPILLDLCCGGGGATRGYQNLGYYVIGVDIQPQPKYCGNEFRQGDALEIGRRILATYPVYAIHASPPCQAYSSSTNQWRKLGKEYPDLIEPIRALMIESHLPYIIENVVGAPLINPALLCGAMFGLRTYRHRIFETSFVVNVPNHPKHIAPQAKMGRPVRDGEFIRVVGHFSGAELGRQAMGIEWLGIKGLAQAIPPVYTQYIGTFIPRTYDAERF